MRLDAELQLLARGDDEPRPAAAGAIRRTDPISTTNLPPNDAHQRAEMVTDLLAAADNVTVDQAIEIAFSTRVWHAERWQARIKDAWQHATGCRQDGRSAAGFRADLRLGRPSLTRLDGCPCLLHAFKKSSAKMPGPEDRAAREPA